MAWTTPRTWVAGETVTAALMNTHVRDNLDYLKADRDVDIWVPANAFDSDGGIVKRGTDPDSYVGISFDPSTAEYARSNAIVIQDFKAASSYKAVLYWSVVAASGNVRWSVETIEVAAAESLIAAKAGAISNEAVPVVDRLAKWDTGLVLAGAADGDAVVLTLFRDAAGDTNTGDALALGVQLVLTREV